MKGNMSNKKNDDVLNAIRVARAYEKVALANARKRAQQMVIDETAEAHEAVIEAVRIALASGQTTRQIGFAYGSSDPTTAKKLVNEAMLSDNGDTLNPHPEWKLYKNDDGSFNIKAYSLGESGLSGYGVFTIDEDGENFSCVEGDMWIQVQLYKLGLKDIVLAEARGE
jgi:hypothetical protein